MKKLIFLILSIVSVNLYAQTTGYIRNDTVKITNATKTATLVLETASKGHGWYLKDIGNGRTQFVQETIADVNHLQDSLTSKANDGDVIHKTGNETWYGHKVADGDFTFTSSVFLPGITGGSGGSGPGFGTLYNNILVSGGATYSGRIGYVKADSLFKHYGVDTVTLSNTYVKKLGDKMTGALVNSQSISIGTTGYKRGNISPNVAAHQGIQYYGNKIIVFDTNSIKLIDSSTYSTVYTNSSPLTGVTGVTHLGPPALYNNKIYSLADVYVSCGTSSNERMVIYNLTGTSSIVTLNTVVDIGSQFTGGNGAGGIAIDSAENKIYIGSYCTGAVYRYDLSSNTVIDNYTINVQGIQGMRIMGNLLIVSSANGIYTCNKANGANLTLVYSPTNGDQVVEGLDVIGTQLRALEDFSSTGTNSSIVYFYPNNIPASFNADKSGNVSVGANLTVGAFGKFTGFISAGTDNNSAPFNGQSGGPDKLWLKHFGSTNVSYIYMDADRTFLTQNTLSPFNGTVPVDATKGSYQIGFSNTSGTLQFKVAPAGATTTWLTPLSMTSSASTFAGNILADANATRNIGASGTAFNNIYGNTIWGTTLASPGTPFTNVYSTNYSGTAIGSSGNPFSNTYSTNFFGTNVGTSGNPISTGYLTTINGTTANYTNGVFSNHVNVGTYLNITASTAPPLVPGNMYWSSINPKITDGSSWFRFMTMDDAGTNGDVPYFSGNRFARLAIGSSNAVLVSTGTAPSWVNATGTGSPVLNASPALTGTPTAPTASAGTNTTQIATTAYADALKSATATLTNKTIAAGSNSITSTPGRVAQFNLSTGNLEPAPTTTTELGYVSGVTSAIQTQLNSKGVGTVTSTSIVTANGISGSVATATTTPAITLTLGAITPTSVNGVSAATMAYMDPTSSIQTQLNGKQGSLTLTTTGSGAATLVGSTLNIPTPSAGTITSLTTTGSSGASTLTSGVLNIPTYTLSGLGGISASSTDNLTHKDLTSGTNTFPTFNQSTTGNAATATALQTARTINGTSFDGTGNITVAASPSGIAGGDLSGTYPNPTINTINGITKNYYDPTSSIQTQLNGKQDALTLTTTGSGAATLVGSTLNVPISSGGVTSITPGYGFTSTTPITSTGTIAIDSTKIQTIASFFTKGDTRYAKLSGDNIFPGNISTNELYTNHLIGTSAPPTLTLGPAAGTGATGTISGNDMCQVVQITMGTSPVGGDDLFQVTFVNPYPGSAPVKVVFNPVDTNGLQASPNVYISGNDPAYYFLHNTLTTLVPGQTYTWTMIVVQ